MSTDRPVLKWQLIDTAPRDGSEVLIAWPGQEPVVGWWERFRGCFAWHEASRPKFHQPTHWMPLPAPPEDVA